MKPETYTITITKNNTEIFKQTVEELDVAKVIEVVNNMHKLQTSKEVLLKTTGRWGNQNEIEKANGEPYTE